MKLQELMNQKGVTAYRLAKDLGVSPSTIKNWIDGKTKLNDLKGKAVADYFGVSVDYLLGRVSHPDVEVIPADPKKVAEHEAVMDKQHKENLEQMHKALGPILGESDTPPMQQDAASMPHGLDLSDLPEEDQLRAEAYIQALRDKNKK